MNGVRFYQEFESPADKRKGNAEGNVFAAFVELRRRDGMIEGVGSLVPAPNSPVCSTAAQWGYLRQYCKRISEARARQIHPRLFAELDRTEA